MSSGNNTDDKFLPTHCWKTPAMKNNCIVVLLSKFCLKQELKNCTPTIKSLSYTTDLVIELPTPIGASVDRFLPHCAHFLYSGKTPVVHVIENRLQYSRHT